MKIHESAEDYLETILILKKEKGAVRSIDIAQKMNFSKPSVSHAMGLFKENGYIVVDRDGWIELTESGLEIAARIYERHRLITRWLTALGVPSDIAAQDACKIEHDISEVTFQKMKEHVGNL